MFLCNNVVINPVVERSKVRFYGRSLGGIVGSNSAGAWISVSCQCRVLSDRGLCDELIIRPEESYRLACVVFEVEKCRKEAALARLGCCTKGKK